MKKIFYNFAECRLRAGWRIMLFILMFWTISATVFFMKPLVGDITKREFLEDYSILIIFTLALAASITVPLARRFLDKRSIVSLGLKIDQRALKDLAFGFILSGLMAGVVFTVMLISGLLEFNGFNFGMTGGQGDPSSGFVEFMSVISIGSLTILFLETVFVGYWEELVFRGYLFQNMIAGMGMIWAIALSCIVYGLIHAMNPNAGWLSSSIIVLFGFLRIYGYLATKMLWLSMGMHIGWNFFQGPVFGYAASGHKHTTLVRHTTSGPDWLTGGAFGPEGSVIVVPVLLMALFIMYWWARRSGKAQ